jgi:hypothetical protein
LTLLFFYNCDRTTPKLWTRPARHGLKLLGRAKLAQAIVSFAFEIAEGLYGAV